MRAAELRVGDIVTLYIPTRDEDSKKYSPTRKQLTVAGVYRNLILFQDAKGIRECFNYVDVDRYLKKG